MFSAVLALLLLLVVIFFLFSSVRRVDKHSTSVTDHRISKPSRKPSYRAGQKFTLVEVSSHNRRDDLWLVIDGKVYDFTSFVEDHPGGDAILRYAGGDATFGFKGPQHPDRVWDMIPDYFIGELENPRE